VLFRIQERVNAAAVCCAGLAAGLIVGEHSPLPTHAVVLCPILVVGLVISGRSALPRGASRGPCRVHDVGLLCLLVLLGALRGTAAGERWREMDEIAHRIGGEIWFRGEVRPGAGDEIVLLAVRPVGSEGVQELDAPLPVLCSALAVAGSPAASGSAPLPISGFARLRPARGPARPGDWDGAAYLRGQGAAAWITPAHLVCTDPAGAEGSRSPAEGARLLRAAVTRCARRARRHVATHVQRAIGGREGQFAATFLLGRRALRASDCVGSDRVAALLQRAGVGHLFAVSGLHVGLLGVCLVTGLTFARLNAQARWLALALLLPAYAALVGESTSVVRAAAGGSLWCLMRAAGRRASSSSLLVMVLASTLWAHPGAWRQAGCQLSYLVAAALIGIAGGKGRGHRVAFVLTAQAVAWPLVMTHNGWGSPLFLLSNALLIPLAAIFLPVALVGLLVSQIPAFPADVALAPAQALARGFLLLAEQLASVCDRTSVGAGALGPGPGAYELVGVAAAFVAAGFCHCHRVRTAYRATAAVGIAAAFTWVACAAEVPAILLLDVGQGESWVCLWKEETWVVDVGPESRRKRSNGGAVAAALRQYGRRRIDRLFLTHDDSDHVGGLAAFAESGIAVSRVHVPWGRPFTPRTSADLASAAPGAAIVPLARGDRLYTAGASLTILHPPRWEAGPGEDDIATLSMHAPNAAALELREDNAAALALRIETGAFALLIASDAPGTIQEEWIAAHLSVQADLVSAAHHGSGGSTPLAFLRAARPRVLLVSAGRGNRFGHPDERVLRDALRCGAVVLRTDLDGTIAVSRTDGAAWRAAGWVSGARGAAQDRPGRLHGG
jgi:competence protein ComEC